MKCRRYHGLLLIYISEMKSIYKSTILFAAVSLFPSFFCPAQARTTAAEAEQYVLQGQQHFRNQQREQAFKSFLRAAELGHAGAMWAVGVCYADGSGVERNVTEAAKWYRKAAEKGDAKAQKSLGLCYAFGDGVEKDASEAVKWFRAAAEQGLANAQ